MFSSLSMRSALVGTSVPTTSTNSRGTRVHRSRRAQSARIPGTFFASFFCSFPLSFVVAFSRRRRFGSTVSKETARYITQRAHEAWIKRVIISYGYFSIFAWRCVHFECSRVRCQAHLRQFENLKRNLGTEDEKQEEEERFIHFFLKFLSKTNLFQLLTLLLLLLLLLLNNSSTKANGRDHGRSLDAERGEKTAAPSKNPFQTHWNCR